MISYDIEHLTGPDEDYVAVSTNHDGEPTGASVAIPLSLTFHVARELAVTYMRHTPRACGEVDCDCPHPAYGPEEN